MKSTRIDYNSATDIEDVFYFNFSCVMFKKFSDKENVSGVQQLKSSAQKAIRNKLLESYAHLGEYMDNILTKKENFKIVKCHEHIEILVSAAGELLFF